MSRCWNAWAQHNTSWQPHTAYLNMSQKYRIFAADSKQPQTYSYKRQWLVLPSWMCTRVLAHANDLTSLAPGASSSNWNRGTNRCKSGAWQSCSLCELLERTLESTHKVAVYYSMNPQASMRMSMALGVYNMRYVVFERLIWLELLSNDSFRRSPNSGLAICTCVCSVWGKHDSKNWSQTCPEWDPQSAREPTTVHQQMGSTKNRRVRQDGPWNNIKRYPTSSNQVWVHKWTAVVYDL